MCAAPLVSPASVAATWRSHADADARCQVCRYEHSSLPEAKIRELVSASLGAVGLKVTSNLVSRIACFRCIARGQKDASNVRVTCGAWQMSE